jgi:iron complex outermembrane receptor protein
MHLHRPASLFLAAVVATGPVLAASAAPPLPVRDEIVVTATPLDDVIQPAGVLDQADLLLRLAPTLGETLERELGVSSSYFGPAASRPVIRGQSGSRVTVLTDAVATLDVSDISPDHAVTIEPLLADGIEIIRGPATLQFGSSAAGGVVNVLDSRVPSALPDSPATGRFEVRGDTAAEERAVVGRLDGALGSFAWHLDAYDRETDDLEIADFATADPAERPLDEEKGTLRNSYSDGDGAAAGLSWIGARGYLGVGLSGFDTTYGLPGPAEEEGEPGEVALYPGPFLDMEQTRVDVRGEYRPGGFIDKVKVVYGTNDYQHTEIEPTGEPATVFNNDAWQLRGEAVHTPLAGWRGVLGLQFDDRDFSALGEEAFIPPTSTQSQGVYLTEQRDTAWGYLQAGARVEPLEHDVSGTLPDYDETAVSAALGVAWDFRPAWRLTSNLSRTERHPAAEELYADGAHLATRQFEIGLLAEPGGRATEEVSTNLDLGLALRAGPVQWSVAVFYNAIEDYIYQEVTGAVEEGLPVAPYAQDEATFWGAEAELTFPLFQNRAWRTSARLFSDYVSAELDDGGDLPRIPPLRLGVELATARGPLSVGLDTIWHARQDQVSSFGTDAFTLVNASVTREFTSGPLNWQLFVRGSNLADEDARRSASFLAAYVPLPGRSLEAGFRTRF